MSVIYNSSSEVVFSGCLHGRVKRHRRLLNRLSGFGKTYSLTGQVCPPDEEGKIIGKGTCVQKCSLFKGCLRL